MCTTAGKSRVDHLVINTKTALLKRLPVELLGLGPLDCSSPRINLQTSNTADSLSSQGPYVHSKTQIEKKHRHPCWSGIRTHDPTNIFRALDRRSATAIGEIVIVIIKYGSTFITSMFL
jgi:hypothetical protein